MKTKFYTFNQNNSGGIFDTSNNLDKYVIIEATDYKQANAIAEDKGIYFNGCDQGLDCDCCGDRWYEVDESDGENEPCIFGKNVESGLYKSTFSFYKGNCGAIHYLNG